MMERETRLMIANITAPLLQRIERLEAFITKGQTQWSSGERMLEMDNLSSFILDEVEGKMSITGPIIGFNLERN